MRERNMSEARSSLPDTPAFCITLAQTKNGSRAGRSESRQIKKPAEAHETAAGLYRNNTQQQSAHTEYVTSLFKITPPHTVSYVYAERWSNYNQRIGKVGLHR